MRQPAWTAWLVLLGLASLVAASARAADNPFFRPLEASPDDAPHYRLGTEADLAAWPSWVDIEAHTLRDATLTRSAFTGARGARIHYRLYQHRTERRGGVVVSSGRTEGLALYQELIHDLVANGYSVYLHDHRGQGFSQRLLASDSTMGYVDDFDHYVEDLARFIDGPVAQVHGPDDGPLFLLAHSMGGAIAGLYLEGDPDTRIAAAALVTPMMEPWVATGSNPSLVVRLFDTYCEQYSEKHRGPIAWLLAEQYADGTSFDAEYAALRQAPPRTDNDLTHSMLRFERHWQTRDQARCDGPDCGSPHAKVGGVSYRWLNQSCTASRRARSEAAARITRPVLLLQGEHDSVVKPAAQKEFCQHLNAAHGPGYCVGRMVPQARHALFIEADRYRSPALTRVLGFFDCIRSGQARCE